MNAQGTSLYSINSFSESQMRTVQAALHTLAQHLPEVNALLDSSFSSISEQFVEVADLITQCEALSGSDTASDQEKAKRSALFHRMSALVSKTIIDMQFQDRVSQNLVITVNVCSQIADFLDLQLRSGIPLDTKLTQQLVHLLNLGDIKQKFIAYSRECGAMEDPSEYGIRDAVVEEKASDDDDIELF